MKNTMYLDPAWFANFSFLTNDQRKDYVTRLHTHGIIQQFADCGSFNEDGTFPASGTLALRSWIKISRAVDPNQQIIVCMNYNKRTVAGTQFGTSAFRDNFVRSVEDMIENFEIDGIHLDIERFQKWQVGDDFELIALLKQVKSIMQGKHFSMATSHDAWSDNMITMVGQVMTQVNPMIYDTMGEEWGSTIITGADYTEYYKDVCVRYASLLKNTSCEFVPSLPSYEQKVDGTVIYHDPPVESMKNAIAGLKAAMAAGARIDGAGIFYGPNYLGLYPEIYNLFEPDQVEWLANWIE